jgi:chromosome segregation ATPase
MAVSTIEVVAPVAASVITAFGTILTFRWQEESKRKKDDRENQLTIWSKVDEIVDERVKELRSDRDQLKKEAEEAKKERNQVSSELYALQREVAVLKSENEEIKLHRTQSINRMRQELNEFGRRNTALTAENAEMKTQLDFLHRENQELKQQLAHVQQQPD